MTGTVAPETPDRSVCPSLRGYDVTDVIPESPASHRNQRDPDAPTSLSPSPLPDKLSSSIDAMLLKGKRVPQKTKRTNEYSLRAFARFVTSIDGFADNFFRAEPHLRSYILDDVDRRLAWQIDETRKVVFRDINNSGYLPPAYADWNGDQLKRVRHFLIEFVVNYRSLKMNGEVKPSSMKAYVFGLQRAFLSIWGYSLRILEGPIFACPDEGLMSVIDNKFSLQQSKGIFSESHNVLSSEDLAKLYASSDLARDTPRTFLARLVLDIALVTAMRPSALVFLTTSQFKKIILRDENVWRIRGAVGCTNGASKTRSGGWRDAGRKPVEWFIWNRLSLGGLLNVYQDLEEYVAARMGMDVQSDRFFLGARSKGTALSNFFRNQHLGRNTFSKIVKDACEAQGISGTGVKSGMTTHGLRGTVTTILVEAGHSDSAVAMRTGHWDAWTLKNYQSLQGAEGERQQADILGECRNGTKRYLRKDNDKGNCKMAKLNRPVQAQTLCTEVKASVVPNGANPCDELSGLKDGTNPDDDDGEEGADGGQGVGGLLSGINSISGGTFTINVNHNYR